MNIFLQKLQTFFRKERKLILAAAAFGMAAAISMQLVSVIHAQSIQNGLAEEFVRFHVLANSDSAEDQRLKLLVRDKVLLAFHDGLSASGSKDETETFLQANLDNIKQTAWEIIREAGYTYPVTVSLCEAEFPRKIYGDVMLPAGTYDALQIKIGEAKGQNWWCVMFPPLCFVDGTYKLDKPQIEQLKTILTDDEMDVVLQNKSEVKISFKLFEIIKSILKK